jgi:hypothetical protein
LKCLVSLGVFDDEFEVNSLTAFFEISVNDLAGAGSIGVAYCAGLYGNGPHSAAQELIGYDLRPGRGDPVQGRIAGEVFEGEERDAFDACGAGSGAGGAGSGHEYQRKASLIHKSQLQRTLYSAARICWNSRLSCSEENSGSALNLSRSLKPFSSALRIYCKLRSVMPAFAQVLARM